MARYSEEDTVRLHRHDSVLDGAHRSLDQRISAAEEQAKETLQADPDEDLLRHWRALGGQAPATITADLGADAR